MIIIQLNIFYEFNLLKDKLNITKLTFTSGVNAASQEFETKNNIDRCPLCGIALNEKGVCPKCGYRKKQSIKNKKGCEIIRSFRIYFHSFFL